MIPLIEIRNGIEKNSGIVESLVKTIYKYPKTTLGLLAGTAIAGYGSSIFKKLHPAHQMLREETKRKAMREQRGILKEMLELQKAKNKPPAAKPSLIKAPLT